MSLAFIVLVAVCFIFSVSSEEQQSNVIPFRTTSNVQPVAQTIMMSGDQITYIRRFIDQQFGLSSDTAIDGCGSDSTTTSGLCVPKLVRLGFHSSVGGSNGCLNIATQTDNAGLANVVTLLSKVWLMDFQAPNNGPWFSLSSIMTRADFWALACTEAVIQGAAHQDGVTPMPTFTFTWGRQDCSTNPRTFTKTNIYTFPDSTGSCNQAFNVFRTMGLTDDLAVALIGGGHSMGNLHNVNSQYTGAWAPLPTTFSNSLFGFLVNPDSVGYSHRPNDNVNGVQKWAFRGDPAPLNNDLSLNAPILLNTDVCMLYEIGNPLEGISVTVNGVPSIGHGIINGCSQNQCKPQQAGSFVNGLRYTSNLVSATAVSNYARSAPFFNQQFSKAWRIMQANGYSIKVNGVYVSDILYNPCKMSLGTTTCSTTVPASIPSVPNSVPTPAKNPAPAPVPVTNPAPVVRPIG